MEEAGGEIVECGAVPLAGLAPQCVVAGPTFEILRPMCDVLKPTRKASWRYPLAFRETLP